LFTFGVRPNSPSNHHHGGRATRVHPDPRSSRDALVQSLDLIALVRIEDLGVMIPTLRNRPSRTHPDLHQPSRHEQALREIIPPVGLPHLLVLALDVERLLSRLGRHQLQPLLVCTGQNSPPDRPPTGRHNASSRPDERRSSSRDSRHGPQLMSDGNTTSRTRNPRRSAIHQSQTAHACRPGNSARPTAKPRASTHRPAAIPHAAFMRHHRPERRMEGHERTARHRHRRGHAGHHVVIAARHGSDPCDESSGRWSACPPPPPASERPR
jgi:hypothetical protein